MGQINPCSAYTAGFLWSSSGLGQTVGLAMAVVAAVAAIALKCLSCCCRRETSENLSETSASLFNSAIALTVAAIPVVGGLVVVHYKVRQERQQREKYEKV